MNFIQSTSVKPMRRDRVPDYTGIIKVLEKFDLLPAIFF